MIAAAFDELGNENRDVALGILASELAQVFEEWSVKVAESGANARLLSGLQFS